MTGVYRGGGRSNIGDSNTRTVGLLSKNFSLDRGDERHSSNTFIPFETLSNRSKKPRFLPYLRLLDPYSGAYSLVYSIHSTLLYYKGIDSLLYYKRVNALYGSLLYYKTL